MSYTLWNIPYTDLHVPPSLMEAGLSPLLRTVLTARGMTDAAEALRFIECSDALLGDPLMMTDMPQAVRRLTHAIAAGEKVAVYGDYDVDGITSTCLLVDYLRSRGLECIPYIPDRLEEGYGLNTGAVDYLCSQGVSLIVTVDCGVTAVEETAYAAALGIDMIITDHHECRDELPDAIAVVDPKRPDCNYPSRDLAGVGVAFKLLCALEGSPRALLDRYSDLVAVGTIADVMPLIGENRYIIRAGLQKLTDAPRAGLRALMDESGLSGKHITATNVGFTLAPRLNASGRLGQASLAAELLLSDDPAAAAENAAALCQLNRDRQAIEQAIWTEAERMLQGSAPNVPIVLACERWHQGVIGIAASRLAEAYHVPAIMICLDGDHGKGSCRSYGGFNLFEALSACADELESFGGHALAAGLTIRRDRVDAFREAIAVYYRTHPASNLSVLDIDLRIDRPELLDITCVQDLDRLEPCGSGNPCPQLCICGAVLESLSPIGSGRHLRLRLSKFGQSYDAVFFSKTAEELDACVGDWVDVAFQAQINDFRGHRSVQLLITDLRRRDPAPALAVLSGGLPDAAARPDRDDFVKLWRALQSRGGVLAGSPAAVFEALAPGMWDVRLCLCLRVFAELGLIFLDFDGQNVTVRHNPDCERIDLTASQILRDLEGREPAI